MNDTAKTSVFVAVAAAITLAAAVASIPRVSSVDDFRDQGEAFFPDFADPDACTSLEVVEVDPATASIRPFKVMKRDGRWVIPSHGDYPADAKDRLAKTAAQVLGLRKDTIRSSRSDDHAKLGVLDPLEAKGASTPEGMGRRITLRDKSDKVLADYILGKDVPGRPGQKFVRRPGQARTYGVNAKVEASTNFAEWIEPNLLDLDSSTARQVIFDTDKVDEERGSLIRGEQLEIDRKADGAPWTTAGLSAKDEVNPEKTSTMLRTLADLKIVGVRPKPRGLAEVLAGGGKQLDRVGQASLASAGFHLDSRMGLVSDEGSVLVDCSDGASLNLRFGRVTFARGEALTAGTGTADSKSAADEKATKGESGAKDAKSDPGAIEARYLFVQATFNPEVVEKPKPRVPSPLLPGTLPKDVFARPAAEVQAELAPTKSDVDAYNKRLEDGKARVATLSKRFAPWYYLVPGDAYRALVLDRASLIRPKPPEGAAPPGGSPFGPGGMPGGMPRGFPPGAGMRPPSPPLRSRRGPRPEPRPVNRIE